MYRCSSCWATALKQGGKCLSCWEWWTLEEVEDEKKWKWLSASVQWKKKELISFSNSKSYNKWTGEDNNRNKFWSNELNTVLGGWIMQWSFILLSGEPWVWKSTLTLQMCDWYARDNKKAVYVSCEENVKQVFSRADRMNIHNENISFLHESNLENILATLEESDATLAIIDSISLVYSDNSWGVSGWVSQVKHIADQFMLFTKRTGKSVILIWHITKDWSISWPKTLEHLVDVVLFMEGDRYETYRILRAFKNRFWATDEIWLFNMTESWFIDFPNPWIEFLNWKQTIGSAIGATMEWTRVLLIELEALSVESKFWYAKRSSRGINQQKTDQMIAILTKYLKVNMDEYDCYVNVWHGINLKDPSIDLSIIAAIYSSVSSVSVHNTVFIWEVSLTWIVKNVPQIKRRVDECIKLWFTNIVIPKWSYNGNAKWIKEIEYVWDILKIIK